MKIQSFNSERGSTTSLSLLVLLAGLGHAPDLSGQTVPDIVWSTNAHTGIVRSVAFSIDSTMLVSGGNDALLQVWASSNATRVAAIPVDQAHVLAGAISPDGALAGGGGDDGRARVWRLADGVRLWIGGPNDELVYSIAFSPDGSLLAIGRSDGINVRYALSGIGIPFGEPEGRVYGVAFSPDGILLASANASGSGSLWRVPTGTLVRNLIGHSNAVNSVDFSPDGTVLATTSSDGTARLWEVTNGSLLRVIQGGGGNPGRFTADGQLLLTLNGGAISLWRVSSGQWLHTYTNAGATTLAVAADGEHFAYGQGDGTVVLARLPLWLIGATYRDYAVTLRWQGGSGRYQVQARQSLTEGQWQNLGGPTTNTTFSSICLSPMFYRVQSLPGP